MKSVFRLLPFLFLLGLSAYLPGVRAETCRANIGQTTVNIPNIKYLPTLPVNTQMTSAMADPFFLRPAAADGERQTHRL